MFSRTTIESSTTRPTATARPPSVRMFSVMPANCMITRAVRIDSGMLTAATNVERRLQQEQEDREDREDRAETALAQQSLARLEDEDGLIGDGHDLDLARVAGRDLVELRLDGLGDRHGVRGARLADRDRDRRLAVGPAVAGRRLIGELDRADVADRDRLGRHGCGRRRRQLRVWRRGRDEWGALSACGRPRRGSRSARPSRSARWSTPGSPRRRSTARRPAW